MTRQPLKPVRAAWELCSACEVHHVGLWILGGGRKQQVWTLSLPAGGETSTACSDRRSAQFCRFHVKEAGDFDPRFRERHAKRELLPPEWWEEPARPVHVAYLKKLIRNRECPGNIEASVGEREGQLKRGEVCEWIEELKYSDGRPENDNHDDDPPQRREQAPS